MHRIANDAGRLDLERRLESVRQSPAEIVFVSSADTELWPSPASGGLSSVIVCV